MKAITVTVFTLFLLVLVGPARACMVDPTRSGGMFQSPMDRFGKDVDPGNWKGDKGFSHVQPWFSDDAEAFAEMGGRAWAHGQRFRSAAFGSVWGGWNGNGMGYGGWYSHGASFGSGSGFLNGWWNNPFAYFPYESWQTAITDALDDFDWDCLENVDHLLIIVFGGYAHGNFDLNHLLAFLCWPTQPEPGPAVPLPGAVVLLGSGLATIIGLRRRSEHKKRC